MPHRGPLVPVLALLTSVLPALAQSQEESLHVYTEHPRLFLNAHRLRLLQREKERHSLRWQQFELLMAGHAPMPEQGFASALYYRVARDAPSGRRAVAWALGSSGTDLRQLALVFDWCQELLSPVQSRALAAKLATGMEKTAQDRSVSATRSRLLAAIALADHLPDVSGREIERIIRVWWRGEIAPALAEGREVVTRDDYYPLYELLHAVRDNLNIDLRESAAAFFQTLPIYDLASYYPATYPAPESEYRIPSAKETGEPDLQRATLARAAELAMVPYDSNAPESQVLQGWLMHDNFNLRSTFGTPYEFLWANPYHPGLSYYLVPLVFHDELFGKLFVRSNWDESARWMGYFDGELQLFEDGKVTRLNPQLTTGPLSLDTAVVYFGKNAQKFQAIINEDEQVFVLGLKPSRMYQIEVDDQEVTEQRTDCGGILPLKLPHKLQLGVRLREAPVQGRSKLSDLSRESAQDAGAGGTPRPR
jgi:hypothetical protein